MSIIKITKSSLTGLWSNIEPYEISKQLADILCELNESCSRLLNPKLILIKLVHLEMLLSSGEHRLGESVEDKILYEEAKAKSYLEGMVWLDCICDGPAINLKVIEKVYDIVSKNEYRFNKNNNGGRYRQLGVGIGISNDDSSDIDVVFPHPGEIKLLIDEMVSNYNDISKQNPIEAVSRLYASIICTHPFADGNGRLSRIMIPHALKRSTGHKYLEVWIGHQVYKRKHEIKIVLNDAIVSGKFKEWDTIFLDVLRDSVDDVRVIISKLIAIQRGDIAGIEKCKLQSRPLLMNVLREFYYSPQWNLSALAKSQGLDLGLIKPICAKIDNIQTQNDTALHKALSEYIYGIEI